MSFSPELASEEDNNTFSHKKAISKPATSRAHHRDLPIVMTNSHTKPMKPEDVGKATFKLNTKYHDISGSIKTKKGNIGGGSSNGGRLGSEESSAYGGDASVSRSSSAAVSGPQLRFITSNVGGRGKSAASAIAGGNGSRGKGYSTTVFSGSKIKHLKKQDGVPLWRKDIQFEFLRRIFDDSEPVFTNSYDGRKGQTFADVYIDAMARSSKTSKILRDKLNNERNNALNMAMVCLLVNLGRMNTTLNFFPEMKAQLRTYHAIPSLQTYTDQNAYKQLQDAPRLKSILKGACEDRKEPITLEHLKTSPVPRTNPINLVFLLSTYAPKISEQHFPLDVEFHDLVMRSNLSSESRARAFLWLMWWYLESDFSPDDLARNPYGEHESDENDFKVPPFIALSEEEESNENVDTTREIEFGERMQEERKKYINVNETNATLSTITKPKSGKKGEPSPGDASPMTADSPEESVRHSSRAKGGQAESDSDDTRSVSPSKRRSTASVTRVDQLLNDTDSRTTPAKPRAKPGPKPGGGSGTPQQIILKHRRTAADSTPGTVSTKNPMIPTGTPGDKSSKPRPLTQHQVAVQENRRLRAVHLINHKLESLDRRKKRERRREGAFARSWKRIKYMEDPFVNSDDETGHGLDGDLSAGMRFDEDGNLILAGMETRDTFLGVDAEARDEVMRLNVIEANAVLNRRAQHQPPKYANGTNHRGCAGLVPREDESDDYGEEAMVYAAALRRTRRRLERWEQEDQMRAAGVEVRRNGKGKETVTNGTSINGHEGRDQDEEMEDEDEDEDARNEELEGDDDDEMSVEES